MTRKLLPATKRYNRQATRQYHTGSKAWRIIRERVLARDLYRCRICKKLCIGKGEAHVDHVDGNSWNNPADLSNYQTLCLQHHAMKTQAETFGDPLRGVDEDGYPFDFLGGKRR